MRFIMPAFAVLLSTCLVTACGSADSVPQTAEESESADDPASDLSELTTSSTETTAAVTETTAAAVTEETTSVQTAVTAAQTAAPQTEPPETEAPQTDPPQQVVEHIVEYVEVPVQQEQPPQQDNGWRDAFAAVLRNNAANYHSFSLCNIDDNDIPELVLHRPATYESSYHADDDVPVYVYSNGQAVNVGCYSYDGNSNFAYFPRSGLIVGGYYGMGYSIVELYRLSGTSVTSEHRFEDDFDAGGTSAKIDGVESGLSQDAFAARKREFYPGEAVSDCGSYDNEDYNIQRYLYG